MAYTLKLDTFSHDLTIKNGHLVRVSGADEVRQRIKIALWHYFNEYFLNRPNGLPYYQQKNAGISILGSKMSRQTIYNIIREKILSIPGVLAIKNAQITKSGRDYYYSCSVTVQRGPADGGIQDITIQNISIGA